MVKKWLTENERFLNYRSLEREIKSPRGIIQKWVNELYYLIKKITN